MRAATPFPQDCNRVPVQLISCLARIGLIPACFASSVWLQTRTFMPPYEVREHKQPDSAATLHHAFGCRTDHTKRLMGSVNGLSVRLSRGCIHRTTGSQGLHR